MAIKHYPIHIRKKIAMVCTIGVALALLILMIHIYTKPQPSKSTDAASKIGHFYATMLDDAQSHFGSK